MGFWSGYRASLKPLEVEEPIDIYVHRPLAYLLARVCFRLPVSPDAITLFSIVFGLASAASLFVEFPHHLQIGGVLLFCLALLHCAPRPPPRKRRPASVVWRLLHRVGALFSGGAPP